MGLLHRVSLHLPFGLREQLLSLRLALRTCRALRKAGLPIFAPLTIFDVGANNGDSFLPAARYFRWWRVFAFEPTPALIEQLRRRGEGIPHYQVIPNAVGDVAGTATFHVDSLGDWGCSSLLEFSDNRAVAWAGREDLEVTSRLEVEVIRLDVFLLGAGLERIDFLHIDTQGTDLRVLTSLGDHLAKVQAGVIEVPTSPEVRLYKNQHTKEEALLFLREHGFEVVAIEPQFNEENVFFRRAPQP